MSERIGEMPKGDRECRAEDLRMVRDFDHQARMQAAAEERGRKHGEAGRLPLESSERYWVGYAEGKRKIARARKNVGLCMCCGDLHL